MQREHDASGHVAGQLVDLIRNHHQQLVPKSMVLSIMHELKIEAKRMKAFKRTTVKDPLARTAHIKNLMVDKLGRRDFHSPRPGAKLVGDITYLRTGEGWPYLATVIDLYSRQIMGWSISDRMQCKLIIDAMELVAARGFIPPGTVFQVWCAGHAVRQSMGRTGVCWDNAVV